MTALAKVFEAVDGGADFETAYGRAWAKLARSEGHMSALPTPAIVKSGEARRRILRRLDRGNVTGNKNLERETGVPASSFMTALRELVDAGRVIRTKRTVSRPGASGGSYTYEYSLSPEMGDRGAQQRAEILDELQRGALSNRQVGILIGKSEESARKYMARLEVKGLVVASVRTMEIKDSLGRNQRRSITFWSLP